MILCSCLQGMHTKHKVIDVSGRLEAAFSDLNVVSVMVEARGKDGKETGSKKQEGRVENLQLQTGDFKAQSNPFLWLKNCR